MHFSQLHSSVESTLQGCEAERSLLYIEMQGFIDVPMLREHVDTLAQRLGLTPPQLVLCDLLGVSGYADGTSKLAREWLRGLELAGVRRVALVAGSSVLRTAVRMVANGLSMQMRCFSSIESANRWLRGGESRAEPSGIHAE